MRAKLIVVQGTASKSEVTLTKFPCVIGRSREATLTVAHPMISRRHCELHEHDGLILLHDLGSLNGTLVEGNRVTEAPLPPSAEFTIGPLSFRLEYEYAGDLNALPPIQYAEGAAESAPPASFAYDQQSAEGQLAGESGGENWTPDGAAAPAEEVPEFSLDDEPPEPSLPPTLDDPQARSRTLGSRAQPAETAEDDFQLDFHDAPAPHAAADEEATVTNLHQAPGEGASPDQVETVDFEPLNPPDAEADDAAEEGAPAKGRSKAAGKDKKGWWPFGGKGKEGKAAGKPEAKKAAAKPAPAAKPAAPAPKKSSAASHDEDLAFEALQEGSGEADAAGGEGDGLDDFFRNLDQK